MVAIAAVAYLGAGCGGSDSSTSSDGGSPSGSTTAVVNVDATKGASLATDPAYNVIDVRTPSEFAAGHLSVAVNIDFESSSFDSEIGKLDKSANYLVYCRSGNRSTQATAKMAAAGFTHVTNVSGGGFDALKAAGAATE